MTALTQTQLLNQLIEQKSLTYQQTEQFFAKVLNGEVEPSMLASVLTALKIKGETPEEIAGAAVAIQTAATPLPTKVSPLCDCVGTGGDGANTINISTTAAILAASCGLNMAKHGNRSVSSLSGSADLLQALGINITMSPEIAAKCLAQTGFSFLFAPTYHSGFKYAAPVRKAMGVRTLFNILGPLVNPAKPEVMLLGVYTPELLLPMAKSCLLNGVQRAWIVHGSGLDELAIHGSSQVIEINQGELLEKTITPADFGLAKYSLDEIKGGTPAENAEMISAILAGKGTKAHNAAVILNTAALLYLSGKADNYKAAADLASQTLASGKALDLVNQVASISQGGF